MDRMVFYGIAIVPCIMGRVCLGLASIGLGLRGEVAVLEFTSALALDQEPRSGLHRKNKLIPHNVISISIMPHSSARFQL